MDIIRSLGAPTSDKKSQIILNIIKTSERNISDVQSIMAGYLRNQERLRKKSVKLATAVKVYGETEQTPGLQGLLSLFSSMLLDREKERDKMIERLQVLSEDVLKLYPVLCNKLKEELRARDATVDKENKKQQQLDKAMLKEAGNRPKISQSLIELAGASHEVYHATNSLYDSAARFEVKKREDMKIALSEFVWSEIQYHTRALEVLSHYHNAIGKISFEEDIPIIQERIEIRSPTTPSPTSPNGYFSSASSPLSPAPLSPKSR